MYSLTEGWDPDPTYFKSCLGIQHALRHLSNDGCLSTNTTYTYQLTGNWQLAAIEEPWQGTYFPDFSSPSQYKSCHPHLPQQGRIPIGGSFLRPWYRQNFSLPIYSYSWHRHVCSSLDCFPVYLAVKSYWTVQRDEVLELSYVLCCIHCNENPIYVFPKSVSDLYIPRIGPHIFLQQIRQTDRGNV